MISSRLILKHAPTTLGEQIHINHEGCPSGEDTRKRLYIKRTTRGILAYCHHCSDHGFVGDYHNKDRLASWLKEKKVLVKSNPIPTLSKLSLEGKAWLAKYHCDWSSPMFFGILGNNDQVALYLMDGEGNNIGYQIRNLDVDVQPKYVSCFFSSRKDNSSWFNRKGKTLVITEDYLSAYRTHRDANVSAVALLRTTISDTTLRQIYDYNFQKIAIWLDPDVAGVRGATQALHKLTHYLPTGTTIITIVDSKEPKEHTPDSLQSFLKEF